MRDKKAVQAEKLEEKKRLLMEKKGIAEPKVEPKIEPIVASRKDDIEGSGEGEGEQPIDPTLQAPTIDRGYSKEGYTVIGQIPDSTPEPEIEAPTIDFNKPLESEIDLDAPNPTFKPTEPKQPERGKVESPGFHDMTSKQKASSAEYLAETAINAYIALNNFGKKFAQFDDEKQQKKALDGQFDFAVLQLELPMSEDGSLTITVAEFLDTINKQAEEAFVVSDEFKSEVKPILTEIFKKKCWGMTPEQKLMALIAEDAGPKLMALVAIKSSMNQILKVSMQLLEQYRGQQKQRPAPAPQPQYSQPAPPPQIQPESKETFGVNTNPNDIYEIHPSTDVTAAKVDEGKVIAEIHEPGEGLSTETKKKSKKD